MPTTAGGTPIFNSKGKQITILSMDPTISNTTAYNMPECRLGPVPGKTLYIATVGGDPSTLIATTGRIYGDTVNGMEMTSTFLRLAQSEW